MDHATLIQTIKRLVIIAISTDDWLVDRLVLKGGNLIDVVLELSARASIDVDFSVEEDFPNVEELSQRLGSALERTINEVGYTVIDLKIVPVPPKISEDMKDFWGGYKVEFKLVEIATRQALIGEPAKLTRRAVPIGKDNSTKFKIDISRNEYCAEKEVYDIEGKKIYGYSPAMLVSEKLRAICQQMPSYASMVRSHARGRAKDFLDIQIVSSNYAIDWAGGPFHQTVRNVFNAKRVPLGLLAEVSASYPQHENDFESVRDTVVRGFLLQPFQVYFDYVCSKVLQLKPLWHE
jgi:Nucleotidyl transferase AbiEii toxin, Type IV TA system